MKITIVGGGNIGTQFAVHCAEEGNDVYIYTSKPDKFSKKLEIVNHEGKVIHEGTIQKATNSSREAFECSDLIFITVPSFAMGQIAKKVIPYLHQSTMIGIIPGNGGGEYAFKEALNKDAIIFGLQRVPSVARLIKYGKRVQATGYRERLKVAALPKKYAPKISRILSSIFKMPCTPLNSYLNLTLTPSNPILHTTRLYTIFKNYVPGKSYENIPLFYEEWNDETTKLLFKCDSEVQKLCHTLKDFDLSEVKSLKEHYENYSVEGFTKKIRSIKGFKGLPTPIIRENGKYIPDLKSRYFTADFNYGLKIFLDIAKLYNVSMPNCEKVFQWYDRIKDPSYDEFELSRFGIDSKEKLESFYRL